MFPYVFSNDLLDHFQLFKDTTTLHLFISSHRLQFLFNGIVFISYFLEVLVYFIFLVILGTLLAFPSVFGEDFHSFQLFRSSLLFEVHTPPFPIQLLYDHVLLKQAVGGSSRVVPYCVFPFVKFMNTNLCFDNF